MNYVVAIRLQKLDSECVKVKQAVLGQTRLSSSCMLKLFKEIILIIFSWIDLA